MEYYLAIKKNKIVTFGKKWTEQEIIQLISINQAQKLKYCMFSLIHRI
jgi:hypothetical protein